MEGARLWRRDSSRFPTVFAVTSKPAMVLSLPPIPPELRPITPHLQRADELAKNDPVISYWCRYTVPSLPLVAYPFVQAHTTRLSRVSRSS